MVPSPASPVEDNEPGFKKATFYLMDCDEEPVYLMGDWSSKRWKRNRGSGVRIRGSESSGSVFRQLSRLRMAVSRSSYWSLFLMASIYAIGELGHFLLGAVSRSMAQELKYGDMGCLHISAVNGSTSDLCKDIKTEVQCNGVTITGSKETACVWDYNGLGLAYQILAGPAFIFMFAFAGLIWGYLADKFNRVYFLSIATIIFSLSIAGTAFSTQYWHVLLFRMALAFGEAGCSPLASGIIADLFPQSQRGLAMSLFNWGIYIGYGFSYAVGNYVTDANIFDQGWRASYVLSGLPGVLIAITFFITVREPPRTKEDDLLDVKGGAKGQSENKSPDAPGGGDGATIEKGEPEKVLCEGDGSNLTIISSKDEDEKDGGECNTVMKALAITWNILKNPAMVFLAFGACVRHSAGYTWGYNSALYFQTYYPDYDVTWWLTGISIAGGTVGTAMGGYLSDRLVNRLGISSRALVLAASQLIASPFAFGLFFLDPPWAMVSLLIGYVAAESWFGVMFAILVELVPSNVRSKSIAVALFIINNVGGNMPIIVDPVASASSYRTAITIFYPGALITSSVLFFICWIILRSSKPKK